MLANAWNRAIDGKAERPTVARDHVWASEIGKSLVDVYYSLKGVQPSNPPDNRAMRKFDAGNKFESIIRLVLSLSGVLQDTQEHVRFQYPGLLEVTGRLDFMLGGTPKWTEEIEHKLAVLNSSDDEIAFYRKVVDNLAGEYPNGIEPQIMELKTAALISFNNVERTNKPMAHHGAQIFHYLKGKGMKRGVISYLCRDDMRVKDLPILNPSPIEHEYKAWIEQISAYYFSNERPPLEKPVNFDLDSGKFKANWKVMYSKYLKLLYNYENQFAFEQIWRPKLASWNRVITRVVKGEKMTPLNIEYIAEMKRFEPTFDTLMDVVKATVDPKTLDTEGKE